MARLEVAAGVVPYTVNAPLWSDGAGKGRWLALPASTAIAFSEAGNWVFLTGTVLIKHFELGGRRLETRLLVVTPGGTAYGVTYKWRADNSDADLDPGDAPSTTGVAVGGGTQTWTFPSRANCMQCHTAVAGYVLGLRTRQLNGTYAYAATQRSDNQLRTLSHLGLFQAPLVEAAIPGYDALAALGDGTATPERRARSYLDANCMHCHQPGGPATPLATFDARSTTALADQQLVSSPANNTLGTPGAMVIAPGDLARSVLYTRLTSVDPAVRMPPLGRSVVDADAAGVFRTWILGLGGTANQPPTATAATSAAAITLPTSTVTLSGSGSDPEGGALSFQWSVAAGSAANVSFATPTAAGTTATFAAAGSYTLRLTATDAQGASGAATVTVVVNPASGGWTAVTAIDCGNVTGAVQVVNGLAYALDPVLAANRQEGPVGGTPLGIVDGTNNTGGAFAYTIAGLTPGGTYRARIRTTEVYFTAAGARVFNATANGTVVAAGIDPYALGGAKFAATEVVTASFPADAAGKVVLGFQATRDNALVTAIVVDAQGGAANRPPTATAATSAAAITLPTSSVALTGAGSDPDGGALAFQWSVAAGSAANVSFATPTAASTTATFAAAGSYTLRLTVSDAQGATGSASVAVTVNAAAGAWSAVAAIDCGNVTGAIQVVNGLAYARDPVMAANRQEGPVGSTPLGIVTGTNNTGGAFAYTFTGLTPGGTCRAHILTTEVYFAAAGARLFNATANGALVASGIDPYALGGAKFVASEVLTATFTADAAGTVVLGFQATRDNALVTGIVIDQRLPGGTADREPAPPAGAAGPGDGRQASGGLPGGVLAMERGGRAAR